MIPTGFVKLMTIACGAILSISYAYSSIVAKLRIAHANPPAPTVSYPTSP